MKNAPSAVLFPAFLLKYMGHELALSEKHPSRVHSYFDAVTASTGIKLNDFDITANNFLDDELKNQLMTYCFSCLYYDMMENKAYQPDYVAGLSMGLYAALYAIKSITFEEGAMVIQRVYNTMQSLIPAKNYSMLSIIGLSEQDIQNLIDSQQLICEVVICNGAHSYIVSGEKSAIEEMKIVAAEEGALHLNHFPVTTPYHSSYLSNIQERSKNVLGGIKIQTPTLPLFSSAKQQILKSSKEISEEIVKNLITPIDWKTTIENLRKQGVQTFVECGPGNSLTKMIRLMDRRFNIVGISEWIKKN